MRHRLKLWLREAYARILFHTGLHALVDRVMPRRLVILAGHCVSAPSNARLPKDMKIEGAKLERILAWLARRYEVTTVGRAWRRLQEPGRRSLVALSMDDGYRDNRTDLLPLLARVGVPATVYLESRPLDERRVNWSHKFFWILDRTGAEGFVSSFGERCPEAREELAGLSTAYRLKRALKYEVDPAARNLALDRWFRELGGDERALCDELYMTWEDARALRDAGVELGGHTVSHEILSRLDEPGAQREIGEGRRSLARSLGLESASLAYPFGRRWDYDARSKAAAREAGFESATTTHAGANGPTSDPYELKRVMIDEDAELHLIVAETCGGFELLRRVGLDVAE